MSSGLHQSTQMLCCVIYIIHLFSFKIFVLTRIGISGFDREKFIGRYIEIIFL